MKLRNKLFVLLLIVSLVPLAAYFLLDMTFSRMVRGRVEKTLKSAMVARAENTLDETIDHYEQTLKMSAQAVRYALRHYANQVQQSLWAVDVGAPLSSHRHLIWLSGESLSKEAHKYRFVTPTGSREYAVDFESLLLFPEQDESPSPLSLRLSQLTDTCKDMYAIYPESRVWIYTVLEDGTGALYPSPGSWPYEADYDFRFQPWYINAMRSRQLTPTPRIEPLTGKSVMTAAMPLFERDGSFAGVVALDIDLSGMLDSIKIPEQWLEGAWKLVILVPEKDDWQAEDVRVFCSMAMKHDEDVIEKDYPLTNICDPKIIRTLIEDSQQGNTGSLRAPCNGVDSLWVYGASAGRVGFPVLVVPYQRIVEEANNALQELFRDNIRAIQTVTILIFAVIVTAVVLAVMRARNLTVPITHLADAAGKLAQGDFSVKVDITTQDELQQLGEVFNHVGPRLQERQKIKQSLELARQIQQHFLPTKNLELEHFQIAGACQYCDETGGDYYDMFDLTSSRPGRTGLVLGDVSGHGIPAAMLMISTGSILRNNAPRHGDNLAEAVSELNRHLVKNSESDKFMTLFYGLLDDGKKTLSWSSAGHDPAIWYHARTGEFTELENTGMPLGVMDGAEFGQAEPITLHAGDIVIIGTDGIWEASNTSDEMYGKERLLDLLAAQRGESAEHIASSVVESVLEFCSDCAPTDDITLVVIKCKV